MKRALILGVSMMLIFLTTQAHAIQCNVRCYDEDLFLDGNGGGADQYNFSGQHYNLTLKVSPSTGQVVQSGSGLDLSPGTTLDFTFNQNVELKTIYFYSDSNATPPEFSLLNGEGSVIGGTLGLGGLNGDGSYNWIYNIADPNPYLNEFQLIVNGGTGFGIDYMQIVYNGDMVENETVVTPEPGTILLMGTGLVGIGWWSRKKEKRHLALR